MRWADRLRLRRHHHFGRQLCAGVKRSNSISLSGGRLRQLNRTIIIIRAQRRRSPVDRKWKRVARSLAGQKLISNQTPAESAPRLPINLYGRARARSWRFHCTCVAKCTVNDAPTRSIGRIHVCTSTADWALRVRMIIESSSHAQATKIIASPL